ncbi:MAG: hypothetical protein K2I80_01790 [Ruminococcus sp.]|nr:hypothetical protein [Ruminococcus sp.]
MDDTMEKIGKLLSDGESMKQLSELAQLLMNETKSSESENSTDNTENNDCGENDGGSFPDISSIMKITELMGTFSQNDKNTELLLALKPHLKEERQQKVDKAIKLLKLMAVWNIAKETGLLNDIL